MQSLSKFSGVFQRNRRNYPEFHVESQRPQLAKSISESWRHHNFWFQIILQSYDNKHSIVLAENRHTDQWSIIESPETHPCIFGQLGSQTYSMGRESFFSK